MTRFHGTPIATKLDEFFSTIRGARSKAQVVAKLCFGSEILAERISSGVANQRHQDQVYPLTKSTETTGSPG